MRAWAKRAAQDGAVHHARQADVVQVGALAADEARILLALQPAEADRSLAGRARKVLGGRHLMPPRLALAASWSAAQRTAADDVLVARATADRPRDRGAYLELSTDPGSRRAARASSSASPACRIRTAARAARGTPCWIGSSSPFNLERLHGLQGVARRLIAARIVHDLTGSPSIRTTQAPQLDVSQPQCVPVRPSVSRMKCTSREPRLDIVRHTLAVDGHRDVDVRPPRAGRVPPRGAALVG